MRKEAPRRSEWDPLLLVSQVSEQSFIHTKKLSRKYEQILALQALHYVTLGILVPPFLMFLADSSSLYYEGGPWNVGMVMDWRELAGRPTVHGLHGAQHRGWVPFQPKLTGDWKTDHSMDNMLRTSG